MLNGKVPIYIIILVVIFILIFIVIIASYPDKSPKVKTKNKDSKNFKDVITDNIILQKITPYRKSDVSIFEFDSLNYKESYIFGGSMEYSSVSIYKNDTLIYSKMFSGNCGFVLSNNIQNVNASFFQIGKKMDLENIKYEYIPLIFDNENVKVVTSNIDLDNYKIYKCHFNYDLIENENSLKQYISSKSLNSIFPLSEYDLEKLIISEASSEELSRFLPFRSFQKDDKYKWEFKGSGKYVIYYVKGLYSFTVKDLNTNQLIIDENNKKSLTVKEINRISQNLTLDYFYIENPNFVIVNKDENIPDKNFNTDLVKLFNTPVELYKQFIYGRKKIHIDIWNRINNKLFIYKVL